MRVVHLCRRFLPDRGGVETHVDGVVNELYNRGYTQTIITLSNESTSPYKTAAIVRIEASEKNGSLWYKLAVWQGMWSNLRLLVTADVIQVHDVFWWLIPFLPLLWGKIYMTFHGYEPPGPPTVVQKFWHRFAALCTKKSLGIGSIHQKWYGVVPDAISYGAVKHMIYSTQRQIQRKKIRAMYLGRVSNDIGIMHYLRAIQIKPVQLDVYGDGNQMEESKKFVQLHQLPVHFMGNVANAAKQIHTYDVIFASSYLAILESLSAGRPIIAFYDTPLKYDYLAQTPFATWITLVNSAEGIAKAVFTLDAPPKKGVAWARAQTWSKLADTYEQLWA